MAEPKYHLSIARRFAVVIAVVGISLSAVALLTLMPLQRYAAKNKAIVDGTMLAESISGLYDTVDRREEIRLGSALLLRVARAPKVAFVSILGNKGEVLYSTERNQLKKNFPIVDHAVEDKGLLIVTHVLSGEAADIAAVVVAMDLDGIYRDLNFFYVQLGLVFLVIIALLALFVAWMTERVVSVRLIRLIETIANAERGSFLVRAHIDRYDEVGAAAMAFNRLLEALTHLHAKDIEHQHHADIAKKPQIINTQGDSVREELELTNKRLERRVQAQELLMNATHLLGGTLNKDAVVNRLLALIRDKLGWPDFAIFLVEERSGSRKELRLARAVGLPNVDIVRQLKFEVGEGITGMVAATGAPICVNDLAKDTRIQVRQTTSNFEDIPTFLKQGSMLSVPMLYQGRVVGVMDFFRPEINGYDQDDIALIDALGAQAAMAVVNAELYEATLELAISDPLTGIMNRRAMERRIENEIARAQRFSAPLAILMIDVDSFKAYNDRMGHVFGDAVLKDIAKRLCASVRKVDGVARFGGEEFCVILPQTTESAAIEVAEKLRLQIHQIDVPGAAAQPLGYLSISIGITVFPDDLPYADERTMIHELLQTADTALYEAKRTGRDRVLTYQSLQKD